MLILQNKSAQGSGILPVVGKPPPDSPTLLVAGQIQGYPAVVRNQLPVAPPVAEILFTYFY